MQSECLDRARRNLYTAVQLLSLVERELLAGRDDDSHTSLEWDERHRAFITHELSGGYIALGVSDLTLLFLDSGHKTLASHALDGKTLSAAFEVLEKNGYNVRSRAPPYQADMVEKLERMPEHAVYASLYDEAFRVISRFAKGLSEAGPVFTWPHHFDMASLCVLDPSKASYKSVGIGFSPGDESIPEPYYYVLPYPKPSAEAKLSVGYWHTKGFSACVLKELDKNSGKAAEFIRQAFSESKRLLQ